MPCCCLSWFLGNTGTYSKDSKAAFRSPIPDCRSGVLAAVSTGCGRTPSCVSQVFSNILQHCGLQGDGASATPQKLEERGRLTPSDMPLLVRLPFSPASSWLAEDPTASSPACGRFPQPQKQLFPSHRLRAFQQAFYFSLGASFMGQWKEQSTRVQTMGVQSSRSSAQ